MGGGTAPNPMAMAEKRAARSSCTASECSSSVWSAPLVLSTRRRAKKMRGFHLRGGSARRGGGCGGRGGEAQREQKINLAPTQGLTQARAPLPKHTHTHTLPGPTHTTMYLAISRICANMALCVPMRGESEYTTPISTRSLQQGHTPFFPTTHHPARHVL